MPFLHEGKRCLSEARSSGRATRWGQEPAPAANKHTQASRTSPHRAAAAPMRPTAPPPPPPAPPSAPSRAAEFPRPPWVPRGRWAPRARPFSRASCELIQCPRRIVRAAHREGAQVNGEMGEVRALGRIHVRTCPEDLPNGFNGPQRLFLSLPIAVCPTPTPHSSQCSQSSWAMAHL